MKNYANLFVFQIDYHRAQKTFTKLTKVPLSVIRLMGIAISALHR